MDQENPNTGWNPTTPTSGSDTATGGGYGTTGGAYGATSGTDAGICPSCGQPTSRAGLEQFLSRLGVTEEMINNLKSQFQNVDIDEYLNTAREYLKNTGDKASKFTKENPGKVAAGVAALALGAGLIYAAVNRDKS